jgi:hypothetical protein
MEDAINFGATISAFASGLAATAAGARILFALSRHTPLERALGTTSTRGPGEASASRRLDDACPAYGSGHA